MKATHKTLLASALTVATTSAMAAGAVVSYPVMGYDNAGDPIYDNHQAYPGDEHGSYGLRSGR